MRLRLLPPESCPACDTHGRVIDTRRKTAYTWRRHVCPACNRRWTTWQTTVDPKRLHPMRESA